ncbi:MAG: hypothetical protein ACR2OY_04825 [Boseongicola sp.]
MTSFAITPGAAEKPNDDLIGPYSAWPRRKSYRLRRPAIYAGGIGLAGVIFHCVIPLAA